MARATCTQCGREVSWYAGRGRRLAEQSCRFCGGALTGRRYGRCAHCGSRRLTENLVALPCEAVLGREIWSEGIEGPQYRPVRHPAGAVVCQSHVLMLPTGDRIARVVGLTTADQLSPLPTPPPTEAPFKGRAWHLIEGVAVEGYNGA